MSLSERLARARELREARARGQEVALGIDDRRAEPAAETPAPGDDRCPKCRTRGTVHLIDLTASRTSLFCPSCLHHWDVDQVLPAHH